MIPTKNTPIVIYGFEGWGTTPFNVSGELIKSGFLEGELRQRDFDLSAYRFAVLPVEYKALTNWLRDEQITPFGFIGLGSSKSAERVTVEKWFRNEFKGMSVIPGIAQGALVPCNIIPDHGDSFTFGDTNSAGTFVCNASALKGFYLSSGQSSFIHIPRQEDASHLPALARGVANAISLMKFSSFNFDIKKGSEFLLGSGERI
jgi:pyrrolidone-carboxylate peptidase